MTGGEAGRLAAAVADLPVPAVLGDLTTRTFTAVSEQAAELFGVPATELVGTEIRARFHPDDREASLAVNDALAKGYIDGCLVRRRVIRPTGEERTIHVRGRRIDTPDGPYVLWMLVPDADEGAGEALVSRAGHIVLAMTDHDWRFDHIGGDAQLLGATSSQLRGQPLLGLVHPRAASDFLEAVFRAIIDHMAVTVATRLRVRPGEWSDVDAVLVPMCEHDPPRLGVAVTPRLSLEGSPRADVRSHIVHAALDAQATAALRAIPALARRREAKELTARQVEIISRLVAGEGIDAIAASIHVSPSTVRNHLTAIYRKFGVHSQAELLASLLRTAGSDRGTASGP